MNTDCQSLVGLLVSLLLSLRIMWSMAAVLTYSQETFPNPQLDSTSCGRNVTSFVCDPGNYLSPEQAAKIDTLIANITNLKNCTCADCTETGEYGYVNFAVAIVPNIAGDFANQEEILAATKFFARHLRLKSWTFRSSDNCTNDVVIVLAIEQHQMYITPGKEADALVNDSECPLENLQIEEEYLRNANYSAMILAALEEYRIVLNGDKNCSDGYPKGWSLRFMIYIGLTLFFFVVVGTFIMWCVVNTPIYNRVGVEWKAPRLVYQKNRLRDTYLDLRAPDESASQSQTTLLYARTCKEHEPTEETMSSLINLEQLGDIHNTSEIYYVSIEDAEGRGSWETGGRTSVVGVVGMEPFMCQLFHEDNAEDQRLSVRQTMSSSRLVKPNIVFVGIEGRISQIHHGINIEDIDRRDELSQASEQRKSSTSTGSRLHYSYHSTSGRRRSLGVLPHTHKERRDSSSLFADNESHRNSHTHRIPSSYIKHIMSKAISSSSEHSLTSKHSRELDHHGHSDLAGLHPGSPSADVQVPSPHVASLHVPSPHVASLHVPSPYVPSLHVDPTSHIGASAHVLSPRVLSAHVPCQRVLSPPIESPLCSDASTISSIDVQVELLTSDAFLAAVLSRDVDG